MRLNSFNLKKYFLALSIFAYLFFMLPSMAADNVISAVTISKAKNKVNAYELNVDSTQSVQYKTNVEDDGSVYFDLKNSVASDDLDTFYDDTANIDNVVVKQIDRNKVRIYVKGTDVKNTELVFANSVLDNSQKKIVLNRPVKEYQSTNSDDLENIEGDEQAWDDNSFNLAHLASSLFLSLKDSALGFVMIVLVVIAAMALMIRSLSQKLSQEKEPLIGLNAARYKDDITFNTVFPNTKTQELQDVAKRNETLRLAQEQLTKAHQKYQDYLQTKYKNATFQNKPKSIGIDPVKQGIALNQYQKSNLNPYLDQEVIRIQKDLQKSTDKENFSIPAKPQFKRQVPRADFTTSTVNTSPYIRKSSPIEPKTVKKTAGSNMRFLESVTKIYEQSGRADLADGLKNTISKSKQTI